MSLSFMAVADVTLRVHNLFSMMKVKIEYNSTEVFSINLVIYFCQTPIAPLKQVLLF